jgi:hypothetical protein
MIDRLRCLAFGLLFAVIGLIHPNSAIEMMMQSIDKAYDEVFPQRLSKSIVSIKVPKKNKI